MCGGIALDWRAVPDVLVDRYGLRHRTVSRNGDLKEYRFLYRDHQAQLPVWIGHQLVVVEWGNRDNPGSRLPRTGWCRQESLSEGKWTWLHPEPVEIPACYGLEKGVWFQIKEGIRGVLVRDEQGGAHVYMLTEPASHYYQVMTRQERMPILIAQRI